MERGIPAQPRDADWPWDWEALGRLVRETAQEVAGRHVAELGGVMVPAEMGVAMSLERDAS